VRDSVFDEELVTRVLLHDPAQYPGCSGTRKLADNINDLKAQVSANAKDAALVADLITERGLATVHRNMHAITANAESYVREFMKCTNAATGGKPLNALDSWLTVHPSSSLRLHWHRRRGISQLQRAANHCKIGHPIRSPLPRQPRHPTQRKLPPTSDFHST
jgi:hypothetical protein